MVRLLFASLLALAPHVHAQDWETATPESQGMDSAALAQLVTYGGNVKMDSLVVVRNGKIVAEAYYAPYRREMLHRINSSTKSVLTALVGIAMAKGELPPPETPLLDLFTDAAPSDPRFKQIKLQHLLDMNSGIAWTEALLGGDPVTLLEWERSSQWEAFVFGRGMAQAPGAGFNYNSGNSHLLSIALTRRTGMATDAYAARHLFAPLGISATRWRKDPQGVPTGHAGLYLHTRDMAKIGALYLRHGEWNGQQVVPRAWVDRIYAPKVAMDQAGYMYADGWWSIPKRKAFFAAGYNRQLIMVLPELGVVAAVTGRAHYPIEDLVSHLERATRASEALVANEPALAALREGIAAAAVDKGWPAGAAEHLPLTRATWQLEDNRAGFRELTLDFTAAEPAFQVKLRSREMSGALGASGKFGLGQDGDAPVFTRSRWSEARTLEIEQRWPEEASTMLYSLKFDGDALEMTTTSMFGARGVIRGRLVR